MLQIGTRVKVREDATHCIREVWGKKGSIVAIVEDHGYSVILDDLPHARFFGSKTIELIMEERMDEIYQYIMDFS